jgi:hypothetical protein
LPRISYYAAPFGTTCAAFIKESRMELVDAAIIDRKPGKPSLTGNPELDEGWDSNALKASKALLS